MVLSAHDEPVFPGGGNTICHCMICRVHRGEVSAKLPVEDWCLKHACSYCHTREVEVKLCNRCKGVRYCGAKCQRAAWVHHKKSCKAPGDNIEEDDRWARMLELFRHGDYDACIKEEELLERQLDKRPDIRQHQDVLDMFAVAHTRAGSLDSAARIHERAAHLLGELQDSVPQAAALFKAGTLLTRTGDDVRSAAVYDKARSIAVRAGCIFVEAEACQALGNVLMRMGDLKQSAAHLKRALDCVESLGDASELAAANQVDKVAHGLLPLLLGTSRSRREITLLLELASAHAEAEQFEQADYFADRAVTTTETHAAKGQRLPEELFANQLRGMIALARGDNATVAMAAASVLTIAQDCPAQAATPMGENALEWAQSISSSRVSEVQ